MAKVGVPEDPSTFVDNPEPRCACALLLDTSSSMSGDPINQLNAGLVELEKALKNDPLASKRVELAIVTFGGTPHVVQDFATVDKFSAPKLVASGGTPMGAAIEQAADMIVDRKQTYKDHEVHYYRPWVFLITDGAPTDTWQPAAQRVHNDEENKGYLFFAVGVERANMDTLAQIAPSSRPPLKLKGLDFGELFVWLSKSLQACSTSDVNANGGQAPLPPVGWNEVPIK